MCHYRFDEKQVFFYSTSLKEHITALPYKWITPFGKTYTYCVLICHLDFFFSKTNCKKSQNSIASSLKHKILIAFPKSKRILIYVIWRWLGSFFVKYKLLPKEILQNSKHVRLIDSKIPCMEVKKSSLFKIFRS